MQVDHFNTLSPATMALLKVAVAFCFLASTSHAYSAAATMRVSPGGGGASSSRRELLGAVASATAAQVLGGAAAPAFADELSTPEANQQLLKTGVNPFNSACMGFGCSDAKGLSYGGAEAPEGIESLPYSSFLKMVESKEVASVEFIPPSGDVAYAILKEDNKRIRIGEGMPEEKGNGWSSPMYVMRILDNKGVPYKFAFKKLPYRGGAAGREASTASLQ